MNATMLAVLNESERRPAAETERDALAALDEEAATELEARVRLYLCRTWAPSGRRGRVDYLLHVPGLDVLTGS